MPQHVFGGQRSPGHLAGAPPVAVPGAGSQLELPEVLNLHGTALQRSSWNLLGFWVANEPSKRQNSTLPGSFCHQHQAMLLTPRVLGVIKECLLSPLFGRRCSLEEGTRGLSCKALSRVSPSLSPWLPLRVIAGAGVYPPPFPQVT